MEIILIIFALIKLSSCLEAHFGSCPYVSSVVKLSKNNLNGTWYDIMKYKSIFVDGVCISFDLKMINEHTIGITTKEYNDGEMINTTRIGEIHNDGSFEFDFTFLKFAASFYVLDTDYKNYLVGFGCKTIGYLVNLQMAFIWSRENSLDDEYITKAYDVFRKYKISTKELQKSEQLNCH